MTGKSKSIISVIGIITYIIILIVLILAMGIISGNSANKWETECINNGGKPTNDIKGRYMGCIYKE